MVKVSVIVPLFNTEKYIKKCLNSLINQTLKDIEIICIDDGSKDNSLAILKEYEKIDSRIKVLAQENQGAGAARNVGLKIANGEYLAFLDSDDFYELDFCEQMYKKAIATESDIVVCSAHSFNMITNKLESMPWALIYRYLPSKEVFNYKDMSKHIFDFSQNWNWNKIFRRNFITKNNINFQNIYRTNDLLFTCKALMCAKKISTVKKELVTYRTGLSLNSQSTNHLHPLDFYEAFVALRKYLLDTETFKEVKQSYVNWALGGLVYNMQSITDKSIKQKMGKFLYKKGLNALGLCRIDYKEIYKQDDLEIFIKQYYKYKKKSFGFEQSKMHYFIYLFGLQLLIKKGEKK